MTAHRLKGRRVLVTGAGGFIGKHMCRHLAQAGATPVGWFHNITGDTGIPGVAVDLTDAGLVIQAASATGPVDQVIHLASVGRLMSESDIPDEIAMWRNVLEQFGESTGHLVFVGSADQYGDSTAPQSEDTPCLGDSPYAAAKNACDALSEAWRSAGRAEVVILRPFSVYGPGLPEHMFLAGLLSACRRRTLFRMSHGLQRRDFIHVEDVCDAIMHALVQDHPAGHVFNVGTGVGRTLREAAEQVLELTRSDIRIDRDLEQRNSDPDELVADTSRAGNVLGWNARISFEAGIRRIWEGLSR